MKNDKSKTNKNQELENAENAIIIQEPQSLDKPKKDTEFAHEAAKFLVDIIKKNNWSKRLGGQSEHIQYEGWQTAGKYYGYLVKTYDAEYVEFGDTWGFKAKAVVVNEVTGVSIGGAEAFCMNDEQNWRNKPKFQLASMAQTRAGSKALRQNLGFVIALAGYNPTPAEEMEGVHPIQTVQQVQHTNGNGNGNGRSTEKQVAFIKKLIAEKDTQGWTEKKFLKAYDSTDFSELTGVQASELIGKLLKASDKTAEKVEEFDIDSIPEDLS